MATQTLTESGEWVEGAAAPRLLPDNLRSLPSELVTRDADDPDKAHEIDAPHVVSTIVKDFAKAHGNAPKDDTAEKVAKKLWAPGPGERAPVRQWFVDVAKMRVIAALVNKMVADFSAGLDVDMTPCHLWFEEDNVNAYFLRSGNPPPRKERPRFLRDIDLTVDVTNPPRSIVELLAAKGIDLDIRKKLKEIEDGRRLIHLV